MQAIVRVENVGKKYSIGRQNNSHTLLREYLAELARAPFRSSLRGDGAGNDVFWALRNISFEVEPGDVMGIIGRNGAGKSTLLKILSRITEPTEGRIELYGRIGSLLEVGTGFHPDLTGRENVYLNGTILGMSRTEVAAKFDEIVEFAGIGKFLDTPVKHYSSGMYMRLAFAVAAHLESEILLVDEVLAVGDAEFQQKCLGKMSDISHQGRTILFVSHSISAIRQLCNKAMLLEKGKVESIGTTHDAVELYLKKSTARARAFERGEDDPADARRAVLIQTVSLSTTGGREKYDFGTDEPIVVNFGLKIRELPKGAVLFVMILNKDKTPVCVFQSEGLQAQMTLQIEPDFLVRGVYSFHALIHIPNQFQFDSIEDEVMFEVYDAGTAYKIYEDYNYGMVFGRGRWF